MNYSYSNIRTESNCQEEDLNDDLPRFYFPSCDNSEMSTANFSQESFYQNASDFLNTSDEFRYLSSIEYQIPQWFGFREQLKESIPDSMDDEQMSSLRESEEESKSSQSVAWDLPPRNEEGFQSPLTNWTKENTCFSPSPISNPQSVKGEFQKKKGRRPKPTGLVQRKDVVLKSLLRRIRNFYWKRFKTLTHFNDKKNREWAEYFRNKLEKYATIEFGEVKDEEFLDTLDSLIKLKPSKSKSWNIREWIYKFSFMRFEPLLSNKCFRELIFHFHNETNFEDLKEDLKIGLEMILKKCNEHE